jgi:hypothetical protein
LAIPGFEPRPFSRPARSVVIILTERSRRTSFTTGRSSWEAGSSSAVNEFPTVFTTAHFIVLVTSDSQLKPVEASPHLRHLVSFNIILVSSSVSRSHKLSLTPAPTAPVHPVSSHYSGSPTLTSQLPVTVIPRITTFRSTTDRIYDGRPRRL